MARISLGICLMLVVASSVIYEAQGTFLLNHYLKKIPKKCNEFTPFANKGMLTFVTNLEGSTPATTEFKNFFTQFKSFMSFIETASASSKNVDAEMTAKCDELFKAMSAMSSGKGVKSVDAGGLKATMLSMGKTLVEQKKNTNIMTSTQKKELVTDMVKWTKTVGTFVKSASEKKGKSIDIASYGLDVDVNDSSIVGGTASSSESSSSSTKTGSVSSKTKEMSRGSSSSGSVSSKTKKMRGGSSASGSASSKTKESSGGSSGGAYKDTTGKTSGGLSGSPKANPSGSAPAGGKATLKGSASATGGASAAGSVSGGKTFSTNTATKSSSERQSKSSSQSSSSTSVKQVESETSKEVMSFIMELEKKYSSKADLKIFFEELMASMQASSSIASKSSKDYVSSTAATTGKLNEAMAVVGARNVKSAKMKSNMDTSKDELIKSLKQLQDINSKIVSGKKVSSTQESELKQTINKWEKVTSQFVETAASSSSSSSSSSSASNQQGSARMVKNN